MRKHIGLQKGKRRLEQDVFTDNDAYHKLKRVITQSKDLSRKHKRSRTANRIRPLPKDH